MKTTDRPSSRRRRSVAKSASTSCGTRTAVGSSRMSTRQSRASALRISTRCCSPTESSATTAPGSTRMPSRSDASATRAAAAGAPGPWSRPPPATVDPAGCASLISTRNVPDLICDSRSLTFAMSSSGTPPGTPVLISASAAPPFATIEKSLRSWAVYEPARTWSMTYFTVGAMFQGTLATPRRGKPTVEEGDLDHPPRVRLLRALDERVDDPVHLRHRITADDTDDVGLRDTAGDHAGEVGGLVGPVVEDGEVRLPRAATGFPHDGGR